MFCYGYSDEACEEHQSDFVGLGNGRKKVRERGQVHERGLCA